MDKFNYMPLQWQRDAWYRMRETHPLPIYEAASHLDPREGKVGQNQSQTPMADVLEGVFFVEYVNVAASAVVSGGVLAFGAIINKVRSAETVGASVDEE